MVERFVQRYSYRVVAFTGIAIVFLGGSVFPYVIMSLLGLRSPHGINALWLGVPPSLFGFWLILRGADKQRPWQATLAAVGRGLVLVAFLWSGHSGAVLFCAPPTSALTMRVWPAYPVGGIKTTAATLSAGGQLHRRGVGSVWRRRRGVTLEHHAYYVLSAMRGV